MARNDMLFPIIWCVLLCILLWTSIRTFKNVAFLSLSKQISEVPIENQGDWGDFTTDQASSDGPPVHVYNGSNLMDRFGRWNKII